MRVLLFVFFACYHCISNAQIITTYAGNGTSGNTGDGAPATAAKIAEPDGCAFDVNGNFYFTTVANDRLRKVTPFGIISTICGTGTSGYNGDGIAATNAQLNSPVGIAIDKFGNIYIAAGNNNRVRKIDAITGIISTIAGNSTLGFSGDNGPATAALFDGIQDICLDKYANLYISDVSNYRIRKIDTLGIITTVAGNGTPGFSGDNGMATSAQLENVLGICTDTIGNLFIAQSYDARVRKVAVTGIITTIAGNGLTGPAGDEGPATAASLHPARLVFDNQGNLYVSGYTNNSVRKIDNNGLIHTVAGTGVYGYSGDNGLAIDAQLTTTVGLALDTCGNLYVADKNNHRIRKVSFNPFCWPETTQNITTTHTINIYPNPANDILHIDNIKTQVCYRLLSIIGTVMQQGKLKEGNNSVSIQSLPAGMYIVEVTNNEGEKISSKIIKQ